jgi:hypothetical protein
VIRRLVSRFRRVAPPAWPVVTFLVIFALLGRPGSRLLILGSAALGVYRVVAFHPYFRTNYYRWLKTTPWTVRKPLPGGPVELVPEDGLALGGLILLGALQPGTRSIELIDVFLFSHTVGLVGTFWRTGVAGFGYTAAWLLGFVPPLWTRPWLALVVLVGIYLFVHEGLWQALRRFPWPGEGILGDLGLVPDPDAIPPCGWFFDRLHRDIRSARGIVWRDAILACLLGSWWIYVLTSLIPNRMDRFGVLAMLVAFAMSIAPGARLAVYSPGYRAPIGFWGRIRTFRWIIPGYDQMFVAPLLALVAAPMTVMLLRAFGTPVEIRTSIAIGMTALVALITPPRLRRWRLTGRHRLAPTLSEVSAESAGKAATSHTLTVRIQSS